MYKANNKLICPSGELVANPIIDVYKIRTEYNQAIKAILANTNLKQWNSSRLRGSIKFQRMFNNDIFF